MALSPAVELSPSPLKTNNEIEAIPRKQSDDVKKSESEATLAEIKIASKIHKIDLPEEMFKDTDDI